MSNVNKPPILDSTGQSIKSKLSDILAALSGAGGNYIPTSQKGAANGVAELGSDGKVPSAQLPSYVDDVLEYASLSAFPATGESGKIYVALDTNKTYRWSGSAYVEISPSLALGETSSTAYRGDRGKTAYDHSQSDHSTIAPAFTEAGTRANIATGESLATMFGKIKKFFTDLKTVAFTGAYSDLSGTPTLGTASAKDVPTSGNASTTQVVMGNDSRLSDSRNAADVYTWAKASTKPSYTASEVGLGNVPNVATNDQTPTYSQASTRANLTSGEKISVSLGKIMKWFADLKDLAFIAKDGASSTKYLRGDGTWQNIVATNATNDSDGNPINTTYVKKAGDEMTGTLTTPADDAKGIIPKTNGRGLLGSITKWFYYLHVKNIRSLSLKIYASATTSTSTKGYSLYASETPSSDVSVDMADVASVASNLAGYEVETTLANDSKLPTGEAIYNSLLKVTTGTITKAGNAANTGTLDKTYCVKRGGIAYVAGRVHTMASTTVANGTFFSIPTGFRPAETTQVMGGIRLVSPDTFYPLLVEITTNGNVNFYYSASSKTTQVYFCGCYPVA